MQTELIQQPEAGHSSATSASSAEDLARYSARFLDRAEAAQYLTDRGLRFSKTTLQKLVTVGGGPVYRRFGRRAVYLAADLDAWAQAKLSTPRCSSASTGA